MVIWSYGLMVGLFLMAVTAFSAEKLPDDPRLAQKVTIDCTNTRLYKAVESISAQTEVKISAGRNESEWTVRDLPVLVCSRDLPLGVLLQSIADADHLLLSSRKSNNVWTYRIWRDPKREAEIKASEEARNAAAIAAASWDWDSFSRMKDIPEDAIPANQREGGLRDFYLMNKALSNIVSQLGTQARDKVLAGDTLVFGLANSPENLKPYMMDAFKSMYEQDVLLRAREGEAAPEPFDTQLKYCHITLGFTDRRPYPEWLEANVSLRGGSCPIMPGAYERYWHDKLGADYAKRPKVPRAAEITSDALDPSYEKLTLEKDAKDAPAFLDTKVKIPKNEAAKALASTDTQSSEGLNMLMRGRTPSYADVLAEVSRATGYSIIAEGQAARYEGWIESVRQDLANMFGGEITVREALEFGTGLNEIEWYIDKKNKLLLGRDTEWIKRLHSLVPESLLLSFREKINGTGMDLDDLEPLVSLSSRQFRFWIYFCPEFPEVEELGRIGFHLQGDSLWKLYFALTPEDKARLKSGETVSLSGYDQGWVAGLVNEWIEKEVRQRVANGIPLSEPWMTGGDMFANSSAKADLSVQLKKKDLPKTDKHVYLISLKERIEGQPEAEQEGYLGPLPIRPRSNEPAH